VLPQWPVLADTYPANLGTEEDHVEPGFFVPPDFSVTTASLNGSIVIAVSGELDLTTSLQVEETLAACNGNQPVVVDLTALTFIDSSGLHVLLKKRPTGRPAALVVEAKSGIAHVLDIVAASKSVLVCHDVQEAMGNSGETDT
jgi:anti-anti-sigma factor